MADKSDNDSAHTNHDKPRARKEAMQAAIAQGLNSGVAEGFDMQQLQEALDRE